ncbi:MAG: hypothetical protein KME20_00790 [Kaiparowitsia implicata GSE-PSE-MK54-09C]|jgi:hypothetical protein|nr:hypothetical protein [Kaiparowitsia implicata GSE-PSE-MK54-09C]
MHKPFCPRRGRNGFALYDDSYPQQLHPLNAIALLLKRVTGAAGAIAQEIVTTRRLIGEPALPYIRSIPCRSLAFSAK